MRAIMNWRYWVLMAVLMLAIVGLFGIPEEDCGAWMLTLIGTKLGGFAALMILWKLAERWLENGSVPELMSVIYFIMEE